MKATTTANYRESRQRGYINIQAAIEWQQNMIEDTAVDAKDKEARIAGQRKLREKQFAYGAVRKKCPGTQILNRKAMQTFKTRSIEGVELTIKDGNE